jgi:hypothetical protein
MDREVVSQDKIRALLTRFFEEPLTPDRLLILSFVIPNFFTKGDQLYQKVLSQVRSLKLSKGVGKCYFDAMIYLALVLLKEKPNSSFPVDGFPLDEEISVPSPHEYIPIALFGWIVFLETGDEKGKKVAEQVIEWQRHLITNDGVIVTAPWMQEKSFSKANLYVWNYLLFNAILGDCFIYKKIEDLSMEIIEKVDPLTYVIAEYLEEKPNQLTAFKESEGVYYFENLGSVVFHFKDSLGAISILGNRTGVGSFSKGQIHIHSFGPHFFPLGEVGYYGIEREHNPLEGSFRDLFFEARDDQFCFSGWTKAVYLPDEGRLWLKVTFIQENGFFRLQIQTENLSQKQNFAFVFFVSAKSAEIGRQVKLLSSSLDRYVGQKEAICFSSGDSELFIEPLFGAEQEVIPLAGMDHFWGADFLVAHTIPLNNQVYEWIIK